MRSVVIIPARMGSSRFPGKPLKDICGLPMIEHVRRRVLLAKNVDDVVVATCDQEIFDVVKNFGGNVVMTSSNHERCTERVEEAARSIEADIIVNVQGDEPLIDPEVVEEVLRPLLTDPKINASNIIHPIEDEEEFLSSHVVKSIINLQDDFIYLSRASIPGKMTDSEVILYKQSGVMAFRKGFLNHFCNDMKIGPLEKRESIDMLRIIENGEQLRGVISTVKSMGVDLPEHIKKVEEFINTDERQKVLFNQTR